MRINSKGIYFSYYGDELLWIWPWKRRGTVKFFSAVFEQGYPSLREYWYYSGGWNMACRKEKVIGFSELDILLSWAKKEFRHDTVIVLRNINVEMKSTVFWKSIDIFARKELLKDVPVIFLRDVKNDEYILHSIPTEFAEAYLFHLGELIDTNNENNFKQSNEEDRGNNQGSF